MAIGTPFSGDMCPKCECTPCRCNDSKVMDDYPEDVCYRPDIFLDNDRMCQNKESICRHFDKCKCKFKKRMKHA